MNFESRCADCAEMKKEKGIMVCAECFNQKCAEIDDCPLGITAETVAETAVVEKEFKNCAQAENKAPRKPRERKPNEDKRHLISMFKVLLEGLHCPVEVTNVERELTFEYNGTQYRITLAVPRK